MANDEIDSELRSILECRQGEGLHNWKEVKNSELAFLEKRKVFWSVDRTLDNLKPIGFKWVFVRKRNEKNEVIRYKARS